MDPHHYDADPDCHFYADPDPDTALTLMPMPELPLKKC
jgi:hypothetical protein